MWLYRKGFTMLLLKMLKLSEPGFAFTDQHFHFILKEISIFRRQGGFLGDLSWQLNKDLHNISSDIFQILFDFYFLISFIVSSDILLFPAKAPEELLTKFPPTVILEVTI